MFIWIHGDCRILRCGQRAFYLSRGMPNEGVPLEPRLLDVLSEATAHHVADGEKEAKKLRE